MKDFSLLEKKLHIKFKDKDLLLQAFVHRSFVNENPGFKVPNNERLEFLGDAILEHAATEYLYKKYPEKSEGELTSLRSALVNAKMLSKVAQGLGFNDFLILSQGESKENGKARQYILANTLEAFIGSLYLDQGIDSCRDFVKKNIVKELDAVIKTGSFRDDKSRFQEEAQERLNITPTYGVIEESGPDHQKNFVVGVFLGKELAAQGEGSSKQEAEVNAAKKALKTRGW